MIVENESDATLLHLLCRVCAHAVRVGAVEEVGFSVYDGDGFSLGSVRNNVTIDAS